MPDRDLEVVLLAQLDPCGKPRDIEVGWTSGFAAFDEAAVEAARTWHFDQHDVLARIPVRYEGAAGSPSMPEPPSNYALVLEKVCRTSVASVSPGADGTVPGFIADPMPIGYASVHDVVGMLQREGRREPDAKPADEGARAYLLGDVLEPSRWMVFLRGTVFSPSVVRSRRVHDENGGVFWVTSGVCGAKDRAACAKFEEFMRLSHARPQAYETGYPSPPDGACPAPPVAAGTDQER